MSNGPSIENYRGVEIRYGYAISVDLWFAHFSLPEKANTAPTMQREVPRSMAAPLHAGKQVPLKSDSEAGVLAIARSTIEAWLGS